jgi:Helix-turn-helix domain
VSAKTNRDESDDLWSALEHVDLDPVQVALLEALQRIDVPLSAVNLVDVLDGYLTMWEARYHLETLRKDGVVEPVSADELSESVSDFDLPYRLSIADSSGR